MGLTQKIWGQIGSWSSSVLQVASGGTGASTLADGGIVIGNGTSAVEVVAPGATTEILVGGGTATKPVWGTDIPTAVTIGTKYVYRADGTDVPVSDGGTGASTLTDHGILLGSGTGAITPLGVATNGQLPIGSTGADPVLAALTEGEAIDITNGAGTITIACEDASTTNKGVVELATNAEALAGTDTSRITTPAGVAGALAVLAREPDQGVAMTYAASGSSGITVADNDNIDFGTGNFTLCWKGSLPNWTPSVALQRLIGKYQDLSNRYQLGINAVSGGISTFSYLHRKAGGTDVTVSTTLGNTFIDGTVHEIIAVITRETASVDGSVSFYVDGLLFETVAITAGTPADISNTGALQVCGNNVADPCRVASTTHHAYTFNRALTAAEVLDLYRNGIAESDKWGSQTAVYTSDFSAGDDSWGASLNITATGNIDGIGGQDNNLRLYASNTAGNHYSLKNASLTLNKKNIITLDYYIPSANTNVKRIALHDGSGAVGAGSIGSTTDAWTPLSVELTAGSFNIEVDIGAASTWFFAGAGVDTDDLVYIRNVVTKNIGATLALEPGGVQPASANSQWLDSSSNKLNAILPAAGASNTRKIDSGSYVWSTAMTDDTTWTSILPAGFVLEKVIFSNSTANTCTLRLGTSAGGTEMAATISIAASTFTTATIDKVGSLTADTTLYLSDTGGGWGSCSLVATLFFRRFN